MLYLSEVRDLSYLSLKLSERQSITLFLQVGLPAGCVAVAKWSCVFGFGFFVRVLFCPCTASPGKSHHEAWRYWLWGHCEARWWMDQHTQYFFLYFSFFLILLCDSSYGPEAGNKKCTQCEAWHCGNWPWGSWRDNFNNADMRNICTEAGMFAIRAERDYVVEEDFMKAARCLALTNFIDS